MKFRRACSRSMDDRVIVIGGFGEIVSGERCWGWAVGFTVVFAGDVLVEMGEGEFGDGWVLLVFGV